MKNGEAYIARSKNRLKSYGKNVYLNDNDNFEIELFNPTKKTIKAEISINGETIYNGGLVIMPGERYFLERFIDKNAKFIFRTYQVENSKEVKDAIIDNGNVTVKFYNQKTNFNQKISISPQPYNKQFWWDHTNSPYFYGNNPSFYNSNFYDSNQPIGGLSGTCGMSGTLGTTNLSDEFETGRIGEGQESSQEFTQSFLEFESFPINIVEMKILPNSTKPMSTKEIRNYCHGCGVRIRKQSWKFCPSCGESLN